MECLHYVINCVFSLDLGHQACFWRVWVGKRIWHLDSWRWWEGGGHQIRFICVSIPSHFSSQYALMWADVGWHIFISALPEYASDDHSDFCMRTNWRLYFSCMNCFHCFFFFLSVFVAKIKWNRATAKDRNQETCLSQLRHPCGPISSLPMWTGVFGIVVFWDNAVCLLGTLMHYKTT